MGMIRQVRDAKAQVSFEGDYATSEESTFEFQFEGHINDATAIKDVLAAQMRVSRKKTLHATYILEFAEGLDITGDAPETLTERLSCIGTGAAHVSAQAEGVH